MAEEVKKRKNIPLDNHAFLMFSSADKDGKHSISDQIVLNHVILMKTIFKQKIFLLFCFLSESNGGNYTGLSNYDNELCPIKSVDKLHICDI